MVSKSYSMGLFGMQAFLVEVETDISAGLPAFDLVGLPDAAVREAREKTNMRMYEVCDAVGYNSVEHFLRTFKRATGQTPLQYRKENVKKHQ